jgi:secondary thiamine-phosphate synthase enzyme
LHYSRSISVKTRGRGTYEITQEVQRIVAESEIPDGLCTVFVHHTSASLILCENADPSVRDDLEAFMPRLVSDGDPSYTHTAEGADDMAAHVRSVLTQASIGIPVAGGRCALGTWQGVYLWEHRLAPHSRRVTVTVIG